MKISVLLLGLCWAFGSRAQTCNLTGVVKGSSIKTVQLYPLYADGPYSTALFTLNPDKQGRFTQTIPLPYPVFALLKMGERQHRLFISPGRDLQLTIGDTALQFAGKAAPENRLVQTSVLNNKPFFLKQKYTTITLAGWKDSIMNPVEQDVAATRARIQQAAIPAGIKAILSRETRYAYQCYLSDLTHNELQWAKNKNSDTLGKLVMQWQSLPDSIALQSGYYANIMLERYERFAVNDAMSDRSDGRKGMERQLAAYLGMPFNQIDSLMRLYGESPILPWLHARRHLPAAIQDKVYYNLILETGDAVHLPGCHFLLQQMQQQFPNSKYLPQATAVVQRLENMVQKNESNNRIVIKSINDTSTVLNLMKHYTGKVVYLDIWGTWCGPCRQEVPYNAALKKRYSGKNIVFVYVALDNPEKEQVWKEYIKLNNLEGEHYRISRKAGEHFWSDAVAAGVGTLSAVPRYMIFDAQGKLVHGDAERPSSEQKLYDQLDKLL